MHFDKYNLPKSVTITFLLSLAAFYQASGQQKDFSYYDSLTYAYYTAKDWKSLITSGKEALASGYDYNYLDVRLGIAYYEMRKFRQAVPHFEKSLINFNNDPVTAEYLYYAYLESGRGNDAAAIALKYSDKFVTVPGASNKKVNFVYAEGGFIPDASPAAGAIELMGADSIYGEEDVFKGQSYFHAGLQFQPGPKARLYIAGNTLGLDKQKHFAYSLYDAALTHRLITDTNFNYSLRQNEFYASLTYTPQPGFSLTPAFHYMGGSASPVNCNYSDYAYSFSETSYNFSHYVMALTLTKEAGNLTLAAGASYAKLAASGNQVQANGSLTWYPAGNLDFYTTTSVTGFKYGSDKRLIIDETLGGKIAPKLWLEGLVTIGDLSYYNEKDAFVVYNLPERITFRGGINLLYTLSSHADISLMYRYYKREYDYFNYYYDSNSSSYLQRSNTTIYNNQGFYGGLKWKF